MLPDGRPFPHQLAHEIHWRCPIPYNQGVEFGHCQDKHEEQAFDALYELQPLSGCYHGSLITLCLYSSTELLMESVHAFGVGQQAGKSILP